MLWGVDRSTDGSKLCSVTWGQAFPYLGTASSPVRGSTFLGAAVKMN